MAETQTQQREVQEITERQQWVAGGLAGFAGGIAMGVLLQVLMTPVITTAIPALYGLDGVVMGWIVHLFHSVMFGLAFAGAVILLPPLRRYTDSIGRSTGLGIAYGILIWATAAAIVMPIWLSTVGFPSPPPLPNFNPMSLVGHVVYGLLLGGLFPIFRNR